MSSTRNGPEWLRSSTSFAVLRLPLDNQTETLDLCQRRQYKTMRQRDILFSILQWNRVILSLCDKTGGCFSLFFGEIYVTQGGDL